MGNNPTDDPNALRAYLQRAEVRISTMHRIAGVFLNGAGLLILFPIFLRDAVVQMVTNVLSLGSLLARLGLGTLMCLAFFLPLVSLYLLLKDLVQFYFTDDHPQSSTSDDNPTGKSHTSSVKTKDYVHPRFILSGIALSQDEATQDTHERITQYQKKSLIHFIIPWKKEEKQYYNDIIAQTNKSIIYEPPGGIDNSKEDEQCFFAAFGLAAVGYRSLHEEVGKMEASLVRHALLLRRLVLRYLKAAILFLATTVILVVTAAFLVPKSSELIVGTFLGQQIPRSELQNMRSILFGLYFYALLIPFLVRLPVKWIYDLANIQDKSKTLLKRDKHLIAFEWLVAFIALLILIVSTVMLIPIYSLELQGEQVVLPAILFLSIDIAWCVLVLFTAFIERKRWFG